MLDDAAEFLAHPGQEAGDVLEEDQRDVEAVAEPHEARALEGGIHVQGAGEVVGLVGHDAHGPPVEAGEADDQVPGEVLLHLEEVAVVHHGVEDVLHVVGQAGRVGHQGAQGDLGAVGIVGAGPRGRVVLVVERHEAHELTDHEQALLVVRAGEMGAAGAGVVGHGPAQVLLADLLVGDRLDDVGPRDEHVGGVLDHEDEVRDGRRIDRAARAGPHDGRDLRHHPRGQHVAGEDVRIARQGLDPFLDARAPRVVEPDDGRPVAGGHVHDLADLFRVGLGEGAAEDGEVLGEDVHQAPVDLAEARDHAVAGDLHLLHAEVVAAVQDELVDLREGALVEQDGDAFPGREPARRVVLGDLVRAPALFGFLVLGLQQTQLRVLSRGHAPSWKEP